MFLLFHIHTNRKSYACYCFSGSAITAMYARRQFCPCFFKSDKYVETAEQMDLVFY